MVTVFTGKCELGQGILTALAQIAAEESDVTYERVAIVSADTARTPLQLAEKPTAPSPFCSRGK